MENGNHHVIIIKQNPLAIGFSLNAKRLDIGFFQKLLNLLSNSLYLPF